MKKNYLFMGLLAVAAAFSSCSSEDTAEKAPDTDNAGSYLAVNIVSSGTSTRAGDFEEGTQDENQIRNLYFYFYDAAGNYLTQGVQYGELAVTPSTGNVEGKTAAVIALGPIKDKNQVAQALAVLNVDPAKAEEFKGKNLSDARKLQQENYAYTTGGKTFYTMTNATYVDAGKLVDATDVTGYIEETSVAALNNPAEIYVERLASKVKVTVSDNIQETVTENGITYDVEIVGYGLDALNKTSYLVKNVDTGWNYTWNGASWTDPTNHRSYWAADPNYEDGNYPLNSTDYNNTDDANSYSLNYVSYGSLKEATQFYCMENTISDKLFTGLFQNSTSLLVAAKFKVEGAQGYEDLYRFMGKIYGLDNYKKEVLNQLKGKGFSFWKKTQATGGTQYDEITTADLTLNEIAETADGEITLKLADGTYYKDNKGAEEWTADDITNAFADVEYADAFKGGMMYYSVPIQHLAVTAQTGKYPTAVGEYGVVRNHVYTINLNSITGLGHAVWNPEQNIVPEDKDKDRYYIGATINILAWKIVPVQNADLQ